MKKFIAFILIVILMTSILISCGGDANTNTQDSPTSPDNADRTNTDNGDTATENQNIEENAEKKGKERIEQDLPEADFEGYTFTFLAANRTGDLDWVSPTPLELIAAEETGEPINDAVYRRNMKIMEKYNVDFNMAAGDERSMLKKAVNAGDDIYGAVVMFNNNVPGIVTGNLLLEISQLPYMDLDKPWWDPAVNALSIANKNYLLAGDLLILDNQATNVLLFNKVLMANLGIELPYNMVKEGKWTMDRLHDMIKDAAADLDGDGVMTNADRWGFSVYNDTLQALLVSGGGTLAAKDENDIPYLSFTSPRNLAVLEKAMDVMYNKDYVANAQAGGATISDFQEDRVLFIWTRMRFVEMIRGMESDFGIVPLPKYDEAQDKYYSLVNSYTGALLGIPKSVDDLNRVSIILEALSAESRYTVQPAYYDVTLQRKYARDEESEAMLDLIFGSRVYDIGSTYEFGGVWAATRDVLSAKQNRNVISMYEKIAGKAQADIDKVVGIILEMD